MRTSWAPDRVTSIGIQRVADFREAPRLFTFFMESPFTPRSTGTDTPTGSMGLDEVTIREDFQEAARRQKFCAFRRS
jgi:hypothetical protein